MDVRESGGDERSEVRGRGGVEVGRNKGGARRRSWSDINTIDGEHE